MTIVLRKTFKCEKIVEELDQLIKEACNLIEDPSTCRLSGDNIQRMKFLLTIIQYHLLEKTNVKKIVKFTWWGGRALIFTSSLNKILCELRKSGEELTFKNFILFFNKENKAYQERQKMDYSFFIPSKIEFKLKIEEESNLMSKIDHVLGIKFEKLSQPIVNEIKSSNYKNAYRNRKVILKMEINSKDPYYDFDEVLFKKIKLFFGILAFSIHAFIDTEQWIGDPNDMSLSENPLEKFLLVVKENKEIFYPNSNNWKNYDFNKIYEYKTLSPRDKWKIDNNINGNYNQLMKFLDFYDKQKNSTLKSFFEDIFALYLDAIIEKKLEFSFLKFWVIIEKIMKMGRKQTDESFTKNLEKIIAEKYLKTLIKDLYSKRNNLVHEFQRDFITQDDRNLSKQIAESIISELIEFNINIDDIEELGILIDNMYVNVDHLKIKKKVIENILTKK
ncbi:MAG: hypothetical protein EAX96_06030 [Candidatus Lokiarchaeota archaeon]|nr:hypothetical protein [Candidatus Lokiarchaeota archaeon]